MEKEYDLDKLGTVLAVGNAVTKDALEMLREQQIRQTHIIQFSIIVIAMAFLVVCWTVHCTSSSINALSQQVEANKVRVEMNTEVLRNERATQAGTQIPK